MIQPDYIVQHHDDATPLMKDAARPWLLIVKGSKSSGIYDRYTTKAGAQAARRRIIANRGR